MQMVSDEITRRESRCSFIAEHWKAQKVVSSVKTVQVIIVFNHYSGSETV